MERLFKPGGICVLLSLAFLVVGLWPFDFFPENRVDWVKDPPALRFIGIEEGDIHEAGGLAFTSHPLLSGGHVRDGSFTIEIRLRCNREPKGSVPGILVFCDSSKRVSLFLGQWKSSLIARRYNTGEHERKKWKEAGIGNVLTEGKTRLITLASSGAESVFYVDGVLERRFPRISLIPESGSLAGLYLLLGNMPGAANGWTGDILGVALYDRFLPQDEVARNSRSWIEGGKSPASDGEGLFLHYRFESGAGRIVQDRSGRGNDLAIPPSPKFSSIVLSPLEGAEMGRSLFIQDALINVIGFIPFGFFLCVWLGDRTRLPHALIAALGLFGGGFFSLFIELMQSQIPVRTSSAADLMSNTLGSGLGVLLYFLLLLHRKPHRTPKKHVYRMTS